MLGPIVMFLISAGIILVITWIVSKIIRKPKEWIWKNAHVDKKELYKGSILDMIREGDYFPSLGRFQFLLWTLVISFAFLSIYLIRADGGVFSFDLKSLPNQLFELMGISVFVPVVGNALTKYKYSKAISHLIPLKKDGVPPFSTMLLEGNKPSLGRYQMFLWTIISILLYLVLFFSSVSQTVENIEVMNTNSTASPVDIENQKRLALHNNLSVPDIDPTLVALMGLSQGGYLGAKLVARQPVKIDQIIKTQKGFSIAGSSFGEDTKGFVWYGDKLVNKDDIVTWSDTRIDVESTPTIDLIKDTIIKIRTDNGLEAIKKFTG